MKYCRFCGKIIDDNSNFCTHCGKAQTTQGSKTDFEEMDRSASRIIKVTIGCIQRMYTKIQMYKFNFNSKVWPFIKKWSKRVVVLSLIIIAFGLIAWIGYWQYTVYQTKKWNTEDERREAIALKNISKADEIAREFFEEYANHSHMCDDYLSYSCDFNHKDRGIKILINAAEKGDAKAQFTLGCIYAGARYDDYDETRRHEDKVRTTMKKEINDESEDNSLTNKWATMMYTEINYEKAAYWWYQAAIQGNASAMEFLANAYRYGRGVEKNLCKATELMRIAAEKDNSWAQLNYGDMFRDGDVWIKIDSVSINGDNYCVIRVKSNIKKAKEWWKKALENGNDSAKERLEKIYE
jgi:Sel1 repeat protein